VPGLLENKVVFVAGLGGVGNGLARRYADEGALLVLGDLDAELASRVATELDPSAERVRGVALDGVHLKFTNAADAYLPGGVVDLPLEAFDEVMRVNTRGFVICAKHTIPPMIAGGGGSIVFTASIDAYSGAGTRVSYQMSKAAELALMRHIARKYVPKGIRANAIAPGLIWHYKFDENPMPDGIVDRRGPGR
jgi:NAD(P)-dependent dehydrogenase (short-subunit alcohol dehydrogenase family)